MSVANGLLGQQVDRPAKNPLQTVSEGQKGGKVLARRTFGKTRHEVDVRVSLVEAVGVRGSEDVEGQNGQVIAEPRDLRALHRNLRNHGV